MLDYEVCMYYVRSSEYGEADVKIYEELFSAMGDKLGYVIEGVYSLSCMLGGWRRYNSLYYEGFLNRNKGLFEVSELGDKLGYLDSRFGGEFDGDLLSYIGFKLDGFIRRFFMLQ